MIIIILGASFYRHSLSVVKKLYIRYCIYVTVDINLVQSHLSILKTYTVTDNHKITLIVSLASEGKPE